MGERDDDRCVFDVDAADALQRLAAMGNAELAGYARQLLPRFVAERASLRELALHAEAEAHRLRERVAGLEAERSELVNARFVETIKQARADERAAVVAWIRSKPWRIETHCRACWKERRFEQTWRDAGGDMGEVAQAIERGDHVKQEGGGAR